MKKKNPPNKFNLPDNLETEEERRLFSESVIGLINLAVKKRNHFDELKCDLYCFSFYFNQVASISQKSTLVYSIQRILSLYPTEGDLRTDILEGISSELGVNLRKNSSLENKEVNYGEIGLSREMLRNLVIEAEFDRETAEELFPGDSESSLWVLRLSIFLGICFIPVALIFNNLQLFNFHDPFSGPFIPQGNIRPGLSTSTLEINAQTKLVSTLINELKGKTRDYPSRLVKFDISIETNASDAKALSRHLPEISDWAIVSISVRSAEELITDFRNDIITKEMTQSFNSLLEQKNEKGFILGVRLRFFRFYE